MQVVAKTSLWKPHALCNVGCMRRHFRLRECQSEKHVCKATATLQATQLGKLAAYHVVGLVIYSWVPSAQRSLQSLTECSVDPISHMSRRASMPVQSHRSG